MAGNPPTGPFPISPHHPLPLPPPTSTSSTSLSALAPWSLSSPPERLLNDAEVGLRANAPIWSQARAILMLKDLLTADSRPPPTAHTTTAVVLKLSDAFRAANSPALRLLIVEALHATAQISNPHLHAAPATAAEIARRLGSVLEANDPTARTAALCAISVLADSLAHLSDLSFRIVAALSSSVPTEIHAALVAATAFATASSKAAATLETPLKSLVLQPTTPSPTLAALKAHALDALASAAAIHPALSISSLLTTLASADSSPSTTALVLSAHSRSVSPHPSPVALSALSSDSRPFVRVAAARLLHQAKVPIPLSILSSALSHPSLTSTELVLLLRTIGYSPQSDLDPRSLAHLLSHNHVGVASSAAFAIMALIPLHPDYQPEQDLLPQAFANVLARTILTGAAQEATFFSTLAQTRAEMDESLRSKPGVLLDDSPPPVLTSLPDLTPLPLLRARATKDIMMAFRGAAANDYWTTEQLTTLIPAVVTIVSQGAEATPAGSSLLVLRAGLDVLCGLCQVSGAEHVVNALHSSYPTLLASVLAPESALTLHNLRTPFLQAILRSHAREASVVAARTAAASLKNNGESAHDVVIAGLVAGAPSAVVSIAQALTSLPFDNDSTLHWMQTLAHSSVMESAMEEGSPESISRAATTAHEAALAAAAVAASATSCRPGSFALLQDYLGIRGAFVHTALSALTALNTFMAAASSQAGSSTNPLRMSHAESSTLVNRAVALHRRCLGADGRSRAALTRTVRSCEGLHRVIGALIADGPSQGLIETLRAAVVGAWAAPPALFSATPLSPVASFRVGPGAGATINAKVGTVVTVSGSLLGVAESTVRSVRLTVHATWMGSPDALAASVLNSKNTAHLGVSGRGVIGPATVDVKPDHDGQVTASVVLQLHGVAGPWQLAVQLEGIDSLGQEWHLSSSVHTITAQ